MNTTSTKRDLEGFLEGKKIHPSGFVPTMGALHSGHLSLVARAIKECRIVTVSIFVNPTQFNDKEDLKNYPRNVEMDLEMLSGIMRRDDIVFIPETNEIYPTEDTRIFNFGNLEKIMEGSQRPGHFNGVAQVVSRLFEIVDPEIAYFGQKDLQQLTIIKELVRQTGMKVKIISCPIIREPDGLAMSSRNMLLEHNIRRNAPVIYRSLVAAANMISKTEIRDIKEFVKSNIEKIRQFNVEYFEIVDDELLVPVRQRGEFAEGKRYFGCIAVRAGKIRLIDNIEISLH